MSAAVVLKTLSDAEAVSQAAADEVVARARDAVAARGRFLVALSGGSTPQRLYQMLADAPYRDQVDWAKVEVFWGDERCVPPDHSDSNYRMAREALLERVPVPAAQVHRIEAERADRAAAARDYEVVLARAGAASYDGPPPQLDLVLLGMGPDGHTASLFPNTAALAEATRWCVVNHVPKFAADRLTLTLPVLNRARLALFLVAGTDKAAALADVLEGPPEPQRLPAQSVRPAGGTAFFVDRLAAARLTRPSPGA